MKVNNSTDVSRRIERVYRDGFMSDVILVVGGREFPAHRLLLSASSHVFETMFSSRWMGEQMTRVELQENCMCEQFFELFLCYIYTGKVEITVKNVLPLLMLADKYVVEDLIMACYNFMDKHTPEAVVCDLFFSWLQYTDAVGHKVLANQCKNFALWNISILKTCKDLSNLDSEILIDLLKQNDLVVESEYKLFEFVLTWLEVRILRLNEIELSNCLSSDTVRKTEEQLVTSVMEHIRFPMMEPYQLAKLHDLPLVLRYKDYFMWRLGVGMSYQTGDQEQADRVLQLVSGSHQHDVFTPRLYMANAFSMQVEMENIDRQPQYVSRTYCFSSRTNLVTGLSQRDELLTDWVIDFYPRGVYYDKFFVIVWQGLLECPERNKQTVRMRLTCQGPHFPLTVKVGVCVYRTIRTLEHVSNLAETMLTFEHKNDTRNIDDVIDFNELTTAVAANEIVHLKMRLIIMPIDKYCSTELRKPTIRRVSNVIYGRLTS